MAETMNHELVPLSIKIDRGLSDRLAAAAAANGRNRSEEARRRLADSFGVEAPCVVHGNLSIADFASAGGVARKQAIDRLKRRRKKK